MAEQQFVWILNDEYHCQVFIGFDHVRRTSKTYQSMDYSKMKSLATKMGAQHKIDVISNFTATIFKE